MKQNRFLLQLAVCAATSFLSILACSSDTQLSADPVCLIQQEGREISKLECESKASVITVGIVCNEEWSIKENADWISLSSTGGDASNGPFSLNVQISENKTESERQAILLLQTKQAEKRLTIIQRAKEDNLKWETASEAVRNMKTGWNLGNTLDACGDWITQYGGGTPYDFETAWGQPVTRPALMQLFADAGFGAIRVPVTWYQHIDETTGLVDAAWMNRVEEVVNYVLDANMYCVLNVHHDTGENGWLAADPRVYNNVNGKFKSLWRQIAERFKGYGERLLFEGYNEMLDSKNSWSTPTVSGAYDAANAYNQDFVDVVRATGGNNSVRNLILNTYSAHAGNLEKFIPAKDITPAHLIVEVHSYAPYAFAFDLSESNPSQDKKTFDAESSEEIKAIIQSLNKHFVSQGLPCIIGEYGAADKGNIAERAKQVACYVSEAARYNICCFHWMGLVNGEDRTKLVWTEPEIRDAILNAMKKQ